LIIGSAYVVVRQVGTWTITITRIRFLVVITSKPTASINRVISGGGFLKHRLPIEMGISTT